MATAALASTVACSKCGSGGGGGYGVVDPMPSPARCYGAGVTATARWVPRPEGGRWLEIDVSAPGGAAGSVYSTPTVRGGTIVAEPAPFVVPAPTLALGIPALTATAAAADAGADGADGGRRRSDAGAADAGDAGAGSGMTTSAIGATVSTWRIEPTAASVHLVFAVTCASASGSTTVTASFGHTKDGGEELLTSVTED